MIARLLFAILALLCASCGAQWQLQDSHTTVGLRGIHAVNDTVAWASGTEGTILHTTDGGTHWEKCAAPPDADKLDFRGIWARDNREALIMSSGAGEASRVYRTMDACKTWSEVARNRSKDGFWDALVVTNEHAVYAIGDPVEGAFDIEEISSGGAMHRLTGCKALQGEGSFAASNSSALPVRSRGALLIATGGTSGARILFWDRAAETCEAVSVQVGGKSESSGVFSLGGMDADHLVAVGGNYKRPNLADLTAAWSADGGKHWTPSEKPPHGFRSAVAWDAAHHFWIAVGTNGSDISRDGGKSWRKYDDGNWNAISGPFVVGPAGRIGRLPPPR